ncbi:MAG: DUF2267 domain-containing protein [Alphaproteobacteria bacterium]
MANHSYIDQCVRQAHVWLKDLAEILAWDDQESAFRALHIVLPLLRRHLPATEAADLAAQLPTIIRGLYFAGWHPAQEPVRDRDAEHFIGEIGRAFDDTPNVGPAEIASAVFTLLARHVSPGEVAQVRQVLPAGVRRFWPAP